MKMLLFLVIVLLLAAGGGGAWYYVHTNGRPNTTFRTAPVERGTLVATISATGTVQPEEVIDVGAQVRGRIVSFGREAQEARLRTSAFEPPSSKFINYRSHVEEGTVLAKIDDALFVAEVEVAKSDLSIAEANVKKVEADLVALRSKYYQSDRDWQRAKKLGINSGALSQLEYDTIQNTYETAKAALPAGEATVLLAKGGVEKAKAALKRAETTLGYTTIVSPVKGVIIDRRVNIGQTVVSDLNAPSLFLIAKDLKKLQVWAQVNEADLGMIQKGQEVRFTVDARPDEVFKGEVGLIRLNANMTQNVVTYTVEVNTDNSKERLIPYWTANLQFLVSQRDDVLQVPNAALRWRPQIGQVAPDARDNYVKSLRRRPGAGAADKDRRDRATLWIEDDGYVRPVKVKIGPSDGVMTEIITGELDETSQVVVGDVRNDNGDATTNPFVAPTFGSRR